jgi:hypothetical protein
LDLKTKNKISGTYNIYTEKKEVAVLKIEHGMIMTT